MQHVPQPRLYGLDALRGICAIAIMIYHFYAWNGLDLFQIGYFGVYIFFILSGFSLWYVYSPIALTKDSLRAFYLARVARVFPLYTLAITLMIILRLLGSHSGSLLTMTSLSDALLNISFLFGFALPEKSSIIVGGWSLGIEAVFYVVFPVFLVFAPRLRNLALILICCYLLNQLYVGKLVANAELHLPEYAVFPVFLIYFVLGIFSANFYQQYLEKSARFKGVTAQIFFNLLAVILLAGIFLYPVASPAIYLFGKPYLLVMLAAFFLIIAAACITPIGFYQKICRFLGDISYATYLMHYIVYIIIDKLLAHLRPLHTQGELFLTAGLVTIICASILYRFYEMPARAFINRMR